MHPQPHKFTQATPGKASETAVLSAIPCCLHMTVHGADRARGAFLTFHHASLEECRTLRRNAAVDTHIQGKCRVSYNYTVFPLSSLLIAVNSSHPSSHPSGHPSGHPPNCQNTGLQQTMVEPSATLAGLLPPCIPSDSASLGCFSHQTRLLVPSRAFITVFGITHLAT